MNIEITKEQKDKIYKDVYGYVPEDELLKIQARITELKEQSK